MRGPMELPSTLNGSSACPCAATSSGFPFAHIHVIMMMIDEKLHDTGGHIGVVRAKRTVPTVV